MLGGMPAQDVATIETATAFVRVKMLRRIADVDEADRLQSRIEEATRGAGLTAVLFDYRGVVGHDESVRSAMWEWAGACGLQALALLVDSELSRVRMNMTALSKRVPIRAFLTENDALSWLTDPAGRRPTREIKPL